MVLNGASLALLLLSGVHMLSAQSNSNTVTFWSSFTLAGLSCSLIDRARTDPVLQDVSYHFLHNMGSCFCPSTLLLSAGVVLQLWGILLLVLVQEPLEVLRNWRSGLVVLDKPWFPHSSGLQRGGCSGRTIVENSDQSGLMQKCVWNPGTSGVSLRFHVGTQRDQQQ